MKPPAKLSFVLLVTPIATRFISGYPGESAVLARRSGDTWFIAGINGKDEPQTLTIDLKKINGKDFETVTTFQDTGDAAQPWDIYTEGAASLSESRMFNCQPRGGFVMILK